MTLEFVKMAQNGSKSLSICPIGSKLINKAPNGSKWHQNCPNGFKISPMRLEWVQMDPNWSKLFQKGLNGSK